MDVLPCAGVRWSVMECNVVYCSVYFFLQRQKGMGLAERCIGVCWECVGSAFQVYCSVLQCVAVCCSNRQ